MKASWSATRKVLASITLVALATAGMTVAGSTAANAAANNGAATVITYEGSNTGVQTGHGTYDSWHNWEGVASSTAIVTDAPSNAGSALKFVRGNEGYSGFDVNVGTSSSPVTDATHPFVTFDVYNAQASDRNVLVKVEIPGGANAQTFVNAVPGWSTVTADFSAVPAWNPSVNYTQLDFFPGFGYGSPGQSDDGDIFYFDNVTYNDAWKAVPAPEVSASPTPTVASIKLDSADLGPADVYSKGNVWWSGEGNGSRNIVKYLPAGGTYTFHYTVVDTAGNPASGVQVTLASSGAADGSTSGDRTKTTDADGKVTFTLVNSTANADAEWPRPDSSVWSDSETNNVAFEFIPYISGSTRHTNCYDAGNADNCNRDRLWGHVVSTATYAPAPQTDIRLIGGAKSAMTDHSNDWWTDKPANHTMVKFVTAGNKLVLTYQVTEGGTPVGAGRTVTLVDDGGDGGAAFTGSLTATTNAQGVAKFVLTNTNASGESRPVAPSTMNYWDNSRGGYGGDVLQKYNVSVSSPMAGSVNYDRVWLHVVSKPSSQAVPAAPYEVTAQRSAAKQITVNWNAATEDGNANTGYEVTLTPKTGAAVVATASPAATSLAVNVVTVTGYTASVKAINSAGKSDATAASGPVTPGAAAPKVPNAPTMPANPTKGVDALWIPFSPSAVDTGATASGFQYTLDNGVTWKAVTYDPAKPGNILFLYNLPSGKSYSVKIRALNSVGAGVASTAKVTATASAPTKAPTLTTVSFVDGTLTIGFTGITATYNGGTAITTYRYSTNGGSTWNSMTSAQVVANKVVLTGLSATSRTIKVLAFNGLEGPASTAKVVSAPTAAPTVTVTAGTGKVTLKITALAAASNGNSVVTGYDYSTDGGTTWTSLSAASATASAGTAITTTKGVTRNVIVRAVNAIGNGPSSTSKSAKAN